MQELALTGFVAFLSFGFFGSLHCLGMCVPLSLVMGLKPGETAWGRLILYHGGRVLSYAGLGFAISLAGLKMQNKIHTPVLAWMVAFPLLIYALKPPISQPLFLGKISAHVLGFLKYFPKVLRAFVLGFLTPLLPCGFLYGAVFASAIAPSSAQAAGWMGAFALGTIPAMLLGQSGALYLSQKIGNRNTQFFLRALALGGAIFILWMAYQGGHCHSCHE